MRVPVGTLENLYISPQVHNDVSAILAAEAKRFLMEKATPESLFAQLREMGVGCEDCKHLNGENATDSGCGVSRYVRYCSEWEGK